jgi:hypothetical protein
LSILRKKEEKKKERGSHVWRKKMRDGKKEDAKSITGEQCNDVTRG